MCENYESDDKAIATSRHQFEGNNERLSQRIGEIGLGIDECVQEFRCEVTESMGRTEHLLENQIPESK